MVSPAVTPIESLTLPGSTVASIVVFGLLMVVAGVPLLASRRARAVFSTLGFTDDWKVNYVVAVGVAAVGELLVLLGIFVVGDQLFSTPRPAPGVEDTPAENRFLLFGFPIGLGLYLAVLWAFPTVVAPRIGRDRNAVEYGWKTKILFAGAILWFQMCGFWALSRGVVSF